MDNEQIIGLYKLAAHILKKHNIKYDEDIIQDLVIYAYSALEKFDKNIGSFSTFVCNCMENELRMIFRSKNASKRNYGISDLSLEKVYDLIDKCQTIIYTLKDDQENKEQIGMIAQEIQEFFPELISEDKDGMLSLDYSRLTVIIFKVLKDLIKRINKIEQKLN